jgi:hypothetical protein
MKDVAGKLKTQPVLLFVCRVLVRVPTKLEIATIFRVSVCYYHTFLYIHYCISLSCLCQESTCQATWHCVIKLHRTQALSHGQPHQMSRRFGRGESCKQRFQTESARHRSCHKQPHGCIWSGSTPAQPAISAIGLAAAGYSLSCSHINYHPATSALVTLW